MGEISVMNRSEIYFFEEKDGRLGADHPTSYHGDYWGKDIVVDCLLSRVSDSQCYFMVEFARELEDYIVVMKGYQVRPQSITKNMLSIEAMKALCKFREYCEWDTFEAFAAKTIRGNIPTLLLKYKLNTAKVQWCFDSYILVDGKLHKTTLPKAYRFSKGPSEVCDSYKTCESDDFASCYYHDLVKVG